MKNFKLHIDENVTPVAHQVGRFPFQGEGRGKTQGITGHGYH